MNSFLAIGECMVEMAPLPEPNTYRRGFAGDTFNTAWYARRLLSRPAEVSYLTAIGEDDASEAMLAFMGESGIDTRHIARRADRTVGLYTIELRDGERSFSYWRSHSAARLLARHLPDPNEVAGAKTVVHVSGITLAILAPEDRERLIEWLTRVRSLGASISFDPNVRLRLWESVGAIREWVERAARTADIVLPSLDEEARDFGVCDPGTAGALAVAERYLDWGARVVAVKNGGAPGVIATDDGSRHVFEPVPVERVVDTTAAGDAFDAGFLVAWMGGADIATSAERAASLSAKVVAHRGALVPV